MDESLFAKKTANITGRRSTGHNEKGEGRVLRGCGALERALASRSRSPRSRRLRLRVRRQRRLQQREGGARRLLDNVVAREQQAHQRALAVRVGDPLLVLGPDRLPPEGKCSPEGEQRGARR